MVTVEQRAALCDRILQRGRSIIRIWLELGSTRRTIVALHHCITRTAARIFNDAFTATYSSRLVAGTGHSAATQHGAQLTAERVLRLGLAEIRGLKWAPEEIRA